MEKDFLPYEESLEMEHLGFNERCLKSYYKNTGQLLEGHGNMFDTPCPTFSQAFRWFRLGYGLFAQPNKTEDREGVWYYFIIDTKRTDVCEGSFTYEEAELSCLRKLIEIVKQKQ